MLSLNHLDLRYGNKHLFKDISGRINDNDRIGLVGVNGTGKSTLLKIMAGIVDTDEGVVTRAKRISTAYLPQEASVHSTGLTVYQEAETAFAEALTLQKDIDAVNRQLGAVAPSSPAFAALLKKQEELQHRLDRLDIYRVGSEIEKVLMGLGFKISDFDLDTSALSGGWSMRLELAKLLLASPSLLMLDEPTNHLDLDSLTWLENFLLTYNGALVIVSHDRTFLDKTTATTWELSLGRLSVFKGNYSTYAEEKETRQQIDRAAYDNQQAQIRQTMRFVQRFRAKSTKAKQVQSRLKMLAKMERIELPETEKAVSFHFPPAAASGKLIIEVEGLSKSFGDKRIFSDIAFHLLRGDKMVVVGINGAGKSTLMKILAGLEEAEQGFIKPGHKVTLSYFGQHQAQELDPELTALETLTAVSGEMPMTQVRSLLGAFLFQGDDVDKKVHVLSGGEKSRLALAKMVLQPANLLILDEPTNHLDMISQEVLQEAMTQYEGAIIIVSHNRYFVNGFINKVLEIKNGKGSIFEGNIDDYLAKLETNKMIADQAGAATPGEDAPSANLPGQNKKTDRKTVRQAQAKARQEKSRRLVPFTKAVAEAEKEIETLEVRKKELEQQMADPALYKDEEAFSGCSKEYKAIERRLERQYMKWEEAQSLIEEIEDEFQRSM